MDEHFDFSEATTADQVPGWDSLAHVRIMMNVEFELDRQDEMQVEETYKAADIGQLLDYLETYVKAA